MIKHEMSKTASTVKLIAATEWKDGTTYPIDLLPVRAARKSHKQDHKTGVNPEGDAKLTHYLAAHRHMSPFEHLSVCFDVVAPIFAIREWMRHRTQSFSEASFRYTDGFAGDVHFPKEWRGQDEKNRQLGLKPLDQESQDACTAILAMAYRDAIKYYDMLLNQGACREQARNVIPVGHMSYFMVSANLRNWAAFCSLRCAPDVQAETRELADMVNAELTNLYPLPWGALTRPIFNQ